MPERHHRVGLAAAEVGLQFDNRASTLAGKPYQCAGQQPLEPFGDERAAEELGRILILVGAFVLIDLPQVGGKLGLLVGALHHVAVRSDHLAQGFKPPCGLPSVAANEVLRISLRRCSSNCSRSRSMRIWPISPACPAETAVSIRSMLSSAR